MGCLTSGKGVKEAIKQGGPCTAKPPWLNEEPIMRIDHTNTRTQSFEQKHTRCIFEDTDKEISH